MPREQLFTTKRERMNKVSANGKSTEKASRRRMEKNESNPYYTSIRSCNEPGNPQVCATRRAQHVHTTLHFTEIATFSKKICRLFKKKSLQPCQNFDAVSKERKWLKKAFFKFFSSRLVPILASA